MNASPGISISDAGRLGEAGADDSAEGVVHDGDGPKSLAEVEVGRRGESELER